MGSSLVFGLGNAHRGDDGVGRAVVDSLRLRLCGSGAPGELLGRERVEEERQGVAACEDEPAAAGEIAWMCRTQLAPEWLDEAAGFERIVFVDAHVRDRWEDVACTRVEPAYTAAAFTHHVTPSMFLALLEALHGRAPEGWAVAVRGHDFGFHEGLSLGTAACVPVAVEAVLRLVRPEHAGQLDGVSVCPEGERAVE